MNREMLVSLVRQFLFVIGGALGFDALTGNEPMLTGIASALVVLGTSAWALWTRTDKNLVASAAAKVPVSDSAQKSVGITKPVSPA